jgi:hypothetical protein
MMRQVQGRSTQGHRLNSLLHPAPLMGCLPTLLAVLLPLRGLQTAVPEARGYIICGSITPVLCFNTVCD